MDIRKYSLIIWMAIFLGTGYWVGKTNLWQQWFAHQDTLYLDAEFDFATAEFTSVEWRQLLGEQDKQLFADLRKQQEALEQTSLQQPGQMDPMETSLFMSALKANTWNALDGYQINQELANHLTAIPGFIVPLEADAQRLSSFFIVPYFGACLHFPPPPPNQIIYVDLPDDMEMDLVSIEMPYMFYGKLSSELFEDPLGTSAWTMDILKVTPYQGEADTTRLHN